MSQKWALELDLGQTWSGSQTNKSMMSYSSQFYPRIWAHYYLNNKWKLSWFYAWFYNKYVPEIDQREYDESRLAMQAIYYMSKTRLISSVRGRLEDRHIENKEGAYEGIYRFRFQVKMIYLFNAEKIEKGAIYSILSDEVFFKTKSNITGNQFFDRNRLTAGGGYSLTDDLQVEATYANEYLPRKAGNESYNAFQLNIAFSNFLPNIKKNIIQPILR